MAQKKKTYQLLAGCCLLLFVILGITVKFSPQSLTGIDHFFSNMIRQGYSPAKMTLFKIITQFGGKIVVGLLCILLSLFLWWDKKYISAIWLAINVAVVAGLGNLTVKYLFGRARPSVEHLVTANGYSFPSGHSMGSMILYGTCILLASQFISRTVWRRILQICLAILILAVGWSRVYLGVHYPTDILGGYLLGLTWLWFSYPIYLKQQSLYQSKKQKQQQMRTRRSR